MKKNYNETIEPPCESLEKVNVGEPIMLNEHEQDWVDSEMSKNETHQRWNCPLMLPTMLDKQLNKHWGSIRKLLWRAFNAT